MSNDHPTEAVNLTRSELEDLLERAAQKGAQASLQMIGLGDTAAGDDIRDLRGFMDTYRMTKRTAWKNMVRRFTDLVFLAAISGLVYKAAGFFH